MWMHMVNTSDMYVPWQVARMSTVAHGSTVNAVGNVTDFPNVSMASLNAEMLSHTERGRPAAFEPAHA